MGNVDYKEHDVRRLHVCSLKKELPFFLEDIGGKEQRLLIELWRNWSTVMGTELSSLALPLGRRGAILLIGGEDTMALQELVFMKTEILERVNAFMDTTFFHTIEVKLCMGMTPLNKSIYFTKRNLLHCIQIPNQSILGKSSIQEVNTPVGRCYKAYLAMCKI